MENKSRTFKSIINIISMIANRMVAQIAGFISRTVFIYTISIEYLGIGSLFSNILGVLSLAEMGIGGAMVYLMYKPMAENDEDTMAALIQLYKKVYRCIGIFILIVGLSLTPFIEFFIAEKPNIPDLHLIYVLSVINTAMTYLVGAYRQAVFQADQKLYIINKVTVIYSVVFTIVQVVILLVFRSYIATVILGIVQNTVINITLMHMTKKQYPFVVMKNVPPVSTELKEHIVKTVKGAFLYKVSASVLNASDSVIISKFVSIVAVAKYTNYSTIITIVRTFLYMLFDGALPSLGNLCASSDIKQKRHIFIELSYLNNWLSGAAAVALAVLLEPFIRIWAGEKFVMGGSAVLILSLKFYVQSSMRATGVLRDAAGLFYESRWLNISQCVVNIFISLILVQRYEVEGVFVGTTIALMTTMFWIQPYVVFKYILQYGKKKLVGYYFQQLVLIGFWCGVYALTMYVINSLSITNLVLLFVVTGVLPSSLYLGVSFKSDGFKSLFNRVKRMLVR